jgi:hypothetical protein
MPERISLAVKCGQLEDFTYHVNGECVRAKRLYMPSFGWFDLTNPAELRSIFHSSNRGRSRGQDGDYQRLANFILQGAIDVTAYTMPEYREPEIGTWGDLGVWNWANRDTGNEEHARLKYNAWFWAAETFQEAGIFELGKKDLALPENKVWIECGDTTPRHVYHSLFQADGEEPFQDWTHFYVFPRHTNRIYEFKISSTNHKMIQHYYQWRHRILKKINWVLNGSKFSDFDSAIKAINDEYKHLKGLGAR